MSRPYGMMNTIKTGESHICACPQKKEEFFYYGHRSANSEHSVSDHDSAYSDTHQRILRGLRDGGGIGQQRKDTPAGGERQ